MSLRIVPLRPLLLAALLLLPGAAACHRGSSESEPVPGVAPVSLVGVWAFNPEASNQSNRPRAGGPGAGGVPGMGGAGGRGGMGGGRGGMGGGRGGMGGGRGGEAEGRGGDQPGGRRTPGDSTLGRPAQQLTIAQTDSTLTFQTQGGTPLTLYFDGRSIDLPAPSGMPAQIAGHWHGKRYLVERRIGSRTITESYERSKDRTKLTVRIRVSDLFGDGPEIQRVYDWVRRE
jgi:hypothetical protein